MLLEYEGLVYTGSPPQTLLSALHKDRAKKLLLASRRPHPAGGGAGHARHERRRPGFPAHREAHPGGRLGGHRQLLGGAHARGARRPGPLHPGPLPAARPGRGLRRGARDQRLGAGIGRRWAPHRAATARDRLLRHARRPAQDRVLRGQVGGGLGRLSRHPPRAPAACPPAIRAAGASRWRWRPSPPSSCATTAGWTCGSSADGTPWVIDVNPNCDLSRQGAGFSRAAQAVGLSYEDLILRLLALAMKRRQDADTIPLGLRSRAPRRDHRASERQARRRTPFARRKWPAPSSSSRRCWIRLRATPTKRAIGVDEADVAVCYACFGQTPMTDATFDLYWLVTSAAARGRGHGRQLLDGARIGAARRARPAPCGSRPPASRGRAVRCDFTSGLATPSSGRIPDFYRPGDDLITLVKRLA